MAHPMRLHALRIRFRSAAVAFVLALVTLLHGARSAADASSEARGYYERATAAYSLGRFAEAATLYEKSFDLKPDPALLYNAAQAHRIAGNKPRALLLYQNYLRVYGPNVTNARDVQRFIGDLKEAIEAEQHAPPPPTAATAESAVAKPATPAAAAATPRADVVATSAPARKPLVKRPAFWIGMAAAVVVVGAAVGLGVAFGTPPSPPDHSFGTVRF
jgi:hypothetical protein